MELAVDAGRGVEHRGENDGERADHGQRAALGRAAGDERNPDEAEADTGDATGADALVGQELEPDQQREDRHRRLGDPRRPRVDVLLAPGDQPERNGGVEEPERDRLPPRLAEALRCRSRSDRRHQVGKQHCGGDHRPRRHQRAGREAAVDADLDEEVGRSPERGERQEERPVATGHVPTLDVLDRRARTRPVASAVPASTSASPVNEVAVTASSRNTAPYASANAGTR